MANLKDPITLPIFFNSKTADLLDELGIEFNEPSVIRSVTFYTIDHIYPYFMEDDSAVCAICSGGIRYICDDTVQNINLAIINKIH